MTPRVYIGSVILTRPKQVWGHFKAGGPPARDGVAGGQTKACFLCAFGEIESVLRLVSFALGMSNSPKWKLCRDCGYKPERKTTRSQCVKCGGFLRVIRGGLDA